MSDTPHESPFDSASETAKIMDISLKLSQISGKSAFYNGKLPSPTPGEWRMGLSDTPDESPFDSDSETAKTMQISLKLPQISGKSAFS